MPSALVVRFAYLVVFLVVLAQGALAQQPQAPPAEQGELSAEQKRAALEEALNRLRDRHYSDPQKFTYFEEVVRHKVRWRPATGRGRAEVRVLVFPPIEDPSYAFDGLNIYTDALRSGAYAKALADYDLLVELLDHILEHEWGNIPESSGGLGLEDDPRDDPGTPDVDESEAETPISEVSNTWQSALASYKVMLEEALKLTEEPPQAMDMCRYAVFERMHRDAMRIMADYDDEILDYGGDPPTPYSLPGVTVGPNGERQVDYSLEQALDDDPPLPFPSNP